MDDQKIRKKERIQSEYFYIGAIKVSNTPEYFTGLTQVQSLLGFGLKEPLYQEEEKMKGYIILCQKAESNMIEKAKYITTWKPESRSKSGIEGRRMKKVDNSSGIYWKQILLSQQICYVYLRSAYERTGSFVQNFPSDSSHQCWRGHPMPQCMSPSMHPHHLGLQSPEAKYGFGKNPESL